MSLADDLARMEAEDRSATPAPWARDNPHEPDCRGCNDGEGEHGAQDYIVGGPVFNHAGGDPEFDRRKEIVTCDSGVYGPDLADATFIVSARTDVRVLREMVKLMAADIRHWTNDAGGTAAEADEAIEQMWIDAKRKAGGR